MAKPISCYWSTAAPRASSSRGGPPRAWDSTSLARCGSPHWLAWAKARPCPWCDWIASRSDRVQVGSSEATGLEASVYDLPAVIGADGLLGLNFLRRFRVTFEFDTRTLVLRPPPPPRPTP